MAARLTSDMKTILRDVLKPMRVAQSQDLNAVTPEAIKEIERRIDTCCKLAVTFHENQRPLMRPSKGKKRGL